MSKWLGIIWRQCYLCWPISRLKGLRRPWLWTPSFKDWGMILTGCWRRLVPCTWKARNSKSPACTRRLALKPMATRTHITTLNIRNRINRTTFIITTRKALTTLRKTTPSKLWPVWAITRPIQLVQTSSGARFFRIYHPLNPILKDGW